MLFLKQRKNFRLYHNSYFSFSGPGSHMAAPVLHWFQWNSDSSHWCKWEQKQAISFEQCVSECRARHPLNPADAVSTFSIPTWVSSLPWLSWWDRTCKASFLR